MAVHTRAARQQQRCRASAATTTTATATTTADTATSAAAAAAASAETTTPTVALNASAGGSNNNNNNNCSNNINNNNDDINTENSRLQQQQQQQQQQQGGRRRQPIDETAVNIGVSHLSQSHTSGSKSQRCDSSRVHAGCSRSVNSGVCSCSTCSSSSGGSRRVASKRNNNKNTGGKSTRRLVECYRRNNNSGAVNVTVVTTNNNNNDDDDDGPLVDNNYNSNRVSNNNNSGSNSRNSNNRYNQKVSCGKYSNSSDDSCTRKVTKVKTSSSSSSLVVRDCPTVPSGRVSDLRGGGQPSKRGSGKIAATKAGSVIISRHPRRHPQKRGNRPHHHHHLHRLDARSGTSVAASINCKQTQTKKRKTTTTQRNSTAAAAAATTTITSTVAVHRPAPRSAPRHVRAGAKTLPTGYTSTVPPDGDRILTALTTSTSVAFGEVPEENLQCSADACEYFTGDEVRGGFHQQYQEQEQQTQQQRQQQQRQDEQQEHSYLFDPYDDPCALTTPGPTRATPIDDCALIDEYGTELTNVMIGYSGNQRSLSESLIIGEEEEQEEKLGVDGDVGELQQTPTALRPLAKRAGGARQAAVTPGPATRFHEESSGTFAGREGQRGDSHTATTGCTLTTISTVNVGAATAPAFAARAGGGRGTLTGTDGATSDRGAVGGGGGGGSVFDRKVVPGTDDDSMVADWRSPTVDWPNAADAGGTAREPGLPRPDSGSGPGPGPGPSPGSGRTSRSGRGAAGGRTSRTRTGNNSARNRIAAAAPQQQDVVRVSPRTKITTGPLADLGLPIADTNVAGARRQETATASAPRREVASAAAAVVVGGCGDNATASSTIFGGLAREEIVKCKKSGKMFQYSTNLNIPTRTTSTLTPTMLRNIADSFMEYDNEVQPPLEHQMAAGFAPPSVIVQQSFTTGSGGSSAAAAAAATTSGAAITTVGGSAAAASSSSLSLSSPPSAIPADVHRTGSLMTSGGQLTVLGGVAVTSSSSSPDSNGSGGLVLDSESSVKQEIIEEDAGWGQTPWANPNSLLPTSIATSTAIGDISDNANSNVGFQPSQLDYPQPSDVIRTASVTSIAPSIAPVISQANCNNDILSGVGGEKQRDGGGGCGGGGGNACTGSSNFTGPDHTGQSLANGARTKTGHSSTTTTTTSRRRIKDERVPPEEEERRRQRRERNKVAAARCRQRRVDQTNDLQLKVDKLEDTQKELRGELDYLKQAKKELEVLLQQHACVRQRQLGIGGHASRVPISTAAGCMPPVSTSSMSVAASLPTISSGTGNSQTTNTTTRSSTMSASSLMSQGAGTGGSAVLSTTSSSSTPLVSSSSSSLIMTAPMATSCSLADAHLSASGLHNHHQHQSQQQQQQQQHQPLSSVPVSTPTQVKVIVRCKDSLDSRLGEVAVTPLTPQPQLQMTEKRARPSSLAVNMFAETGVAVQTPTEGMYSFEGLVEGTGLTPGATPVATPVAFSPSCTTQQQRSHSSDSMQTPETPRKLVTL